MDALGELSGVVHDDLERVADLLERLGQCVSASACGVSGGRGVADGDAAVSAVVLEGDQCAVSRDGGVGVSLLFHVAVCDQRDFVCVLPVDFGRVASAGAGTQIDKGCNSGDVGGFASAQGFAAAEEVQRGAADCLHRSDSDGAGIAGDGAFDL